MVRDVFSHINATKIKFGRKLRAICNEIDSSAVFHPRAPWVPCHSVFFLFLNLPQSIYVSSFLCIGFYPPHPFSLLELLSLLCYHLSPSVPAIPPPFLSCHCCLLPLLSRSNYITAPDSRLQILTQPSDERFWPTLSRSTFRFYGLIPDTVLKVPRAGVRVCLLVKVLISSSNMNNNKPVQTSLNQ